MRKEKEVPESYVTDKAEAEAGAYAEKRYRDVIAEYKDQLSSITVVHLNEIAEEESWKAIMKVKEERSAIKSADKKNKSIFRKKGIGT